jgi:hypothetical protein
MDISGCCRKRLYKFSTDISVGYQHLYKVNKKPRFLFETGSNKFHDRFIFRGQYLPHASLHNGNRCNRKHRPGRGTGVCWDSGSMHHLSSCHLYRLWYGR